MKSNLVAGLVAGIVMLIASLVVNWVSSAAFPELMTEYSNINLYRPWEDPLMSYVYIHPLISGILLSFVWQKVKDTIEGDGPVSKGIRFGTFFWIVFSVPGMLITLSTFQVSVLMILTWTIMGLIQMILVGMVFAHMDK